MKKIIALLITSTLIMTGCSTNNTSSSSYEATSSQISAPTLFKDREGTEFTLPAKMDKIMSTAPSNTEVLIALGMGDKLAVVDKYSKDIKGVPANAMVVDFRNPDIEAIIESQCDILIASGHNRVGGEDPYHQIKAAGITVVYIPTSVSFDGIYGDIEFLATLTGTMDKGSEIIQDMKKRVKTIEDTVSKATEKKTVYMEISPAPSIVSCGTGTFLDEVITKAGGINICAGTEQWPKPSEEIIITTNPQIIITNNPAIEDPTGEIMARTGWNNISAVQNNQVFYIDKDASSRSSHNVVIALEEMAKAIHPELFV